MIYEVQHQLLKCVGGCKHVHYLEVEGVAALRKPFGSFDEIFFI